MQPVVFEELTINRSEVGADAVQFVMTGKSNARDPAKFLVPYFAEALNTAAARHTAIEMHFEGMEQFNSSTIGAIIQIINAARSKGVELRFVYAAEKTWQALSFGAVERTV